MPTPRIPHSVAHEVRTLCVRAAVLAVLATFALAARASAATNTATLTVSVGSPVVANGSPVIVDNRIFGLNTAIWNSWTTTLGDGQVQGLITQAKTQALRYPGGSTADTFHWATSTRTYALGMSTLPDLNRAPEDDSSSGTTWPDFVTFYQAVGIDPNNIFITLNYGTGTVAEAVAWLTDANVTRKLGIKHWELGNECYGAAWEMDGNTPAHDAVEYAKQYAAYYKALKAVDPTIKLGAVAGGSSEDSYAQTEVVTNPVTLQAHAGWGVVMLDELKTLGVTPDFLIYHQYPEAYGFETDVNLLQSASSPNTTTPWSLVAANLRTIVNDYLGAAGANVELDCTENNNCANAGKETVSIVDGLYMADSVGSILQTEFKSLIWWDMFNGQTTGTTSTPANLSPSLYGWRIYGDFGVMNAGGEAYPAYYVHKMLSHFARGGDSIVRATSTNDLDSQGNALIAIYAAKHVDSSVSIMVINKDPKNTWTGNLTISGYTPPSSATVYSYGIPQDNAANPKDPTYGTASPDVQQSTMTGVSSSFSTTFGPYSVTILDLAPPLPTITLSPTGQTINMGSTLVLTAAGSNAASYQWLLNGTPVSNSGSSQTTDVITGASGPELVIGNPTSLSAGSYTVEAVNGSGTSAPSSAAVVSVVTSSTPGIASSLSSRAFVGTGDNILIGGFYIVGSTSRTVLVQAIGPGISKAPYNVSGTLSDPVLSIHQYQNGKDVVLYSNAGWGSSQVLLDAAASVYANPVLSPGSGDSELLVTLPPGGYTAEVTGDGTSTGVALCGIYQLP
jgi:hypothetical protein